MEQFTPNQPTPELHVPDTLPPISAPTAGPNPMPTAAPTQKMPGHKRQWLIWAVIAVIIAGLGGGGYFAYSRGYLPIPWLTPKEDKLFSRFVDSLAEIDNAQYTVRLALKSEARDKNATSIFPSADERAAKNRDAQRKSDLAQIRTALTLYYDDNGRYPDTTQDGLEPNYITRLPIDPEDESDYTYEICGDNKKFILSTGLESGDYYYLNEAGTNETVDEVPACNASANTNGFSWLRLLVPAAQAQTTTYSIESIGSEIGLGEAEYNYPLLSMLDMFGLGDMESILDVFPLDIDTSGAITFYAEADKRLSEADASLAIEGQYTGDDLTASLDLELRKIGPTVYGQISKFPGIPYVSQFVTPLKNKWIKLEPNDGNPVINEDTFDRDSIQAGIDDIKDSIQDTMEGEIFTVERTIGTETIAGVKSVRYRLALHPDKIKPLLQKIMADRKAKDQSVETLEEMIDQLDQPGTLSSLQKFADNSTVEVWVDKVKGYLRQISWSIVLVPPEESDKLKDKQFRITMSLTLDKVNQKVNIDKPSGAIDYDEAERLVTGISVAEQKFNRQRNRISSIRSTLTAIKAMGGSYPKSIESLSEDFQDVQDKCNKKKESDRNTNTYSYTYCYDYYGSDRATSIENVYTGKPYGFKLEGDDYRLTYQMELDFNCEDTDYSSCSYYKDDYVTGINTASSLDISREKQTTAPTTNTNTNYNRNYNYNYNANTNYNSNLNTNTTTIYSTTIDADGDGLKNIVETYCGANINKSDTDNDGYNDKTEVQNGYNPNGAGRLTSPYCTQMLQSYP